MDLGIYRGVLEQIPLRYMISYRIEDCNCVCVCMSPPPTYIVFIVFLFAFPFLNMRHYLYTIVFKHFMLYTIVLKLLDTNNKNTQGNSVLLISKCKSPVVLPAWIAKDQGVTHNAGLASQPHLCWLCCA